MSLSFFKSNWVTSLSSPCNHMISDSHSTAPAPLLNIHHHDLSSEKQTRANLVLLRTQKSHANIRIPSATVIEMPKHIPHWACVAKCRYLRPRCEPVLLDSGLLRKQLRRHRVPVAMAALLMLAVTIGFLSTLGLWRRCSFGVWCQSERWCHSPLRL